MTIESTAAEWDPAQSPFGGVAQPIVDANIRAAHVGEVPDMVTSPSQLPPHLRVPSFPAENTGTGIPDTEIDINALQPAWGVESVAFGQEEVEVPEVGTQIEIPNEIEVAQKPSEQTVGASLVEISSESTTFIPTLTARIYENRATRAAQRAQRIQQAKIASEQAEAERTEQLQLRADESLIRFATAALQFNQLLSHPVTATGTTESPLAPLYRQREVESLFLTRYINNQVLAPRLAVLLNEQFPAATTQEEVQTRLASAVDRRIESLQKSLEEQEQPDLEEIAELKSMLAMRDSAVLDEKLLETIGLLDRVAQYLDTPGRKSVYNSTDPFVRERHDKFAINQALKYVHAAIEQATEEFIINPYPENGQHHRVQAFEVLQKAIGLSELEATVDGYNTQPVVVTRLIYHCDTKEVTVDPEINGVGKLYASFGYSPEESFGGFTFYETTADGRPDPRNITGFVQKRPIYDSYDGYFAVQMKQAGLSFDDTTEKLDDGTVAFFAKFEVNPVQVQLVMNTLLLNTLTKEIVQKGMQAQPMNHPLDLTKPSVRVLAGMALPTEQMLVEAAITASMAGRETQAATLAAELARVNSTMNMPMFAPPALGSAAILAVHPGHPQGHPTTEQE